MKFSKGHIPWNKGKKNVYSKETLEKMHFKKIGKRFSLNTEFKKGIVPWNKGKPGYSTTQKGKKLSLEHVKKVSEAHKGKHCNPKHEFKKGDIRISKENHWQWKGGISSLHKQIRRSDEYKNWRNDVLKRDNYKCKECNSNKKIEAHHHKVSFSNLLISFIKEYSQFSPIEDKETLVRLAITHNPFWNIDNGSTLCRKCHQQEGKHRGEVKWITDERLNCLSSVLMNQGITVAVMEE